MIEQSWVFLEQNPTPSEPQTTNHVNVRPSRPSVVLDRKCAHNGSLDCDSTPKSAFRRHSRPQDRRTGLDVVFVFLRCRRRNGDVPSSSLHSVRAGPGSVGRWRASPLLSHFSLISRKMDRLELVIQIWPCTLDVCQLFVCKVLVKPVLEYFSLSQQKNRIPCICDDFQQHRQCWTLEVWATPPCVHDPTWRTVMCDLSKHSTSRTNESTQCRRNDDSAQKSSIWSGAESSKSDAKVDNGSAPLVLSSEHANAGADSQDRVCSSHFVLIVPRFRSAVTCDPCCFLVVTRHHHR